MIHMRTETEHWDFGIDEQEAPEYDSTPSCCGTDMTLIVLDEWGGTAALTFVCTTCGRYEIR